MHRLLRVSLFLLIAAAFVAAQDVDDDGDDDGACVCTAQSEPVCGIDGNTYNCASCANVDIACTKECPCNNIACSCLAEGPQVCGANGVTFGNECLAGCEGVAKDCDGPCPCDDDDDGQRGRDVDQDDDGDDDFDRVDDDDDEVLPDCVCTLIYDPVCGFDQEIYGNQCVAQCSGAEIACEGECPCEVNTCNCPEVRDPVCGVDGVNYDNECFARCVGVPVDCNQQCGCDCDEGLANCAGDLCQDARCPAYPDATCYPTFCGGCNTIFVFRGEIVDCDVSPPQTCLARGERCDAHARQFADRFPDEADEQLCCGNLQCCPNTCFNEDVDDDDDFINNGRDVDDNVDAQDIDDDGDDGQGSNNNDGQDVDIDDDGDDVFVTSVFGTCRNSCDCRKR